VSTAQREKHRYDSQLLIGKSKTKLVEFLKVKSFLLTANCNLFV
jgi:hypothetical protein